MVPARINFVVLGTHNQHVMRDFYKSLGWRETENSDDKHAEFVTAGGVLMLYPFNELAKEMNLEGATPPTGFKGFGLAINLESREAVDSAFEVLRSVDAEIAVEPVERFWGGYSGYFADPEGNYWEVAWNPYLTFDERGAAIVGA